MGLSPLAGVSKVELRIWAYSSLDSRMHFIRIFRIVAEIDALCQWTLKIPFPKCMCYLVQSLALKEMT